MRFVYVGFASALLKQVICSDSFGENKKEISYSSQDKSSVVSKAGFKLAVEPEVTDISRFDQEDFSCPQNNLIALSKLVFKVIPKLNFDIFNDDLENYKVQVVLESLIDLFINIFESYEHPENSDSEIRVLQQFASFLDGLDVDIDAYKVIPRKALMGMFEQMAKNIPLIFSLTDRDATINELNKIKRSISESNPEELRNGLNTLLSQRKEVIDDITSFAPQSLSSLIFRVNSQVFGISAEFKSLTSEEECDENDEKCLSLEEDREAKNFVRILNSLEVVMKHAISEPNSKEIAVSWLNMINIMANDFSTAADDAIEVVEFVPRKGKTYDVDDGSDEDVKDVKISGNSATGSGTETVTEAKMSDKELEALVMQKLTEIMQSHRQTNPQVGQALNLYQSEKDKLEAALGDDSLPEMSQASLLAYLRTSSLPRLVNNAIKGKFGIDVLESLALALKVINEGLGAVEVILKLLIKTVQMIRYYTLHAAEFVASMSEDHSKPIGDSVTLAPLEKKTKFGCIKKMFKGAFSTVTTPKTDPTSAGIGLALRKAREYAPQINSLPGAILLRIFHTIINEMDRSKGAIRNALASKTDKTVSGLKSRLDVAMNRIYEAVRTSDPLSPEYLDKVPHVIFSEILMEFVSPLKLSPTVIVKAITDTTKWLKPILAATSDEIQINILTFILSDSEAEDTIKLAGTVPEFGNILNAFVKKRK